MEIIIGRQGTQKTPITDPTVSRQHCKVTDNGDGTYTIENLSPSGTKVDGVDILRTTVKPNSRIQLGQSFSATLVELIGVPQEKIESNKQFARMNHSEQQPPSPKTQPDVKTFNISHLRRVWEDYNNTNLEMAESQRKTNLVRTGLGIFTMCAMPTIFFFGLRNAETAEARQKRQDAFDDAWVCPNPDCGHSLLAKNYKLLVRNHQSCPYCKCRYVEK